MTAVLAPPTLVRRSQVDGRSRPARTRASLAAHGEQTALFVLFYAAYVAVGSVLLFHYGSVANDAVSRVDDGSNAIYSYQPHLAAVGFVWNPLPSLLEIPLLLLKGVWPALLAEGFAGNLLSAAFMAGAVVGVRGILADRGAGRTLRLMFPLLFALHPMSIVYGANGMSEAYFIFFMVWATRALLRYVSSRASRDLVVAGTCLGLGYLARYEAAAAAAGATLMVALIVYFRASGTVKERVRPVLVDLTLLVTPFALAFIGWSVSSFVIVGHAFEQFSSAYGNDGFILSDHNAIAAATGQGTSAAIPYALKQMLALEPFAILAVGAAAVVAVRRRSWTTLVPLAVFGPVIAFALVAFLAGETFGWLRFYIMEIPLTVVTVAVVLPARVEIPDDPDMAVAAGFTRGFALLAALAVLVPATYTGARSSRARRSRGKSTARSTRRSSRAAARPRKRSGRTRGSRRSWTGCTRLRARSSRRPSTRPASGPSRTGRTSSSRPPTRRTRRCCPIRCGSASATSWWRAPAPTTTRWSTPTRASGRPAPALDR